MRKTKPKRRATVSARVQTAESVLDTAMNKPYRPLRMKPPPPTDIELTAKRVSELVSEIGMIRRRIGHIETDLACEKTNLASSLLSHQQESQKLRELALVPQPSV